MIFGDCLADRSPEKRYPTLFSIKAQREKENVYSAVQWELAKPGGQGPDLGLAAEEGTLPVCLADPPKHVMGNHRMSRASQNRDNCRMRLVVDGAFFFSSGVTNVLQMKEEDISEQT